MRWGKKYLFITLVGVLLISVFIVGCIGETVAQSDPVKQHVDYLLPSAPLSLDPANLQDEAGYQFWLSLFEGLVRMQPDGTLAMAMAEDWEILEEGKKYIFTLRETATWSDGQTVTAHDFVSAFKRNLDPALQCPYAYLFYDIKNAEAYHRSTDIDYYGPKANEDKVGIWAEDERTLVIELEKRNPAFLKKLLHPVFYPLPVQALQSEKEYLFFTPTNLIGNGPFKLEQVESEQHQTNTAEKFVLVKNETYWDKEAVKLESMVWYLPLKQQTGGQLFKEKKVTLTSDLSVTEVAAGLKKGQLHKSPLLGTYFYQFNVAHKPLNDLRVRQALSFALERRELVEEVLRGGQEPAQGLIPQGMPDSTPGSDFRLNSSLKIPDNNLREAQRLLSAAGYPAGAKFPELELLVSSAGGHQYLAEMIKEEWETNLGIKVKLTALDWRELVERMSERDYDIGLLGWVADYPDPSAFLKHFASDSGNNDTAWFNEDYDLFLKEALNSDEEAARMQALHQAEDILITELPLLPIYEYNKVYAAQEALEGLYFSPLGQGIDFKWTLVK